MKFDIEELYRSISEDLLKKAINYAKTFVDISSDEEEIILCNVEYLYFSIIQIYRKKKESNKDFEVTMGSFDGTEICELVGLYILYILSTRYGRNHNGIYRDDGLAWLPKRKRFPSRSNYKTLLIYLGKHFN